MTRYVLINDQNGGGFFCLGIFDDIRTAIGHAMNCIWDFKDSYKDPADVFIISDPYNLEGDGGIGIKVTFKDATWKEEDYDYYYILFSHSKDKEEK